MISEASLSRVWQHVNSDRPIALLTAFRNEYTRKENLARNRTLATDIRKAGYGYFFVDGYWIENQGTPQEVHVAEDSIFVVGDEHDQEGFLRRIVQFGKQYNQDAVLVKNSQGAKLYSQTGEQILDVGTLKPGKVADIYTRLRTGKQADSFVFEAERDDLGWLKRLAGISTE
jgi:hypothetical protein